MHTQESVAILSGRLNVRVYGDPSVLLQARLFLEDSPNNEIRISTVEGIGTERFEENFVLRACEALSRLQNKPIYGFQNSPPADECRPGCILGRIQQIDEFHHGFN